MLQVCQPKPVVLDCSGTALREVLRGSVKPKLIKPNTEELAGLLGREISTELSDLKAALSDSMFDEIEWIVVSMGATEPLPNITRLLLRDNSKD